MIVQINPLACDVKCNSYLSKLYHNLRPKNICDSFDFQTYID